MTQEDLWRSQSTYRRTCHPIVDAHVHYGRFVLAFVNRPTSSQLFAAMVLCGKLPARSKVRSMFDTFDFDSDGKLNPCEAILMLR